MASPLDHNKISIPESKAGMSVCRKFLKVSKVGSSRSCNPQSTLSVVPKALTWVSNVVNSNRMYSFELNITERTRADSGYLAQKLTHLLLNESDKLTLVRIMTEPTQIMRLPLEALVLTSPYFSHREFEKPCYLPPFLSPFVG